MRYGGSNELQQMPPVVIDDNDNVMMMGIGNEDDGNSENDYERKIREM